MLRRKCGAWKDGFGSEAAVRLTVPTGLVSALGHQDIARAAIRRRSGPVADFAAAVSRGRYGPRASLRAPLATCQPENAGAVLSADAVHSS